MTTCEDPFAVLGVSPEASAADVKRAYRRLAMHWHPDRNPAAVAEAEFKRVNAAYELFLDPQRLAEWRQAQAASGRSRSESKASASNARASSGEASRSGAGKAAGKQRAGKDVTESLTLSLEEAALGCRKTVVLTHGLHCGACRGSGRVQHRNSVPCKRCSGCGRVSRGGGGTSVCEGCAGRGFLRETECPPCSGSGWLQQARTLSVAVPPGLFAGERLRLAGQAPLPAGSGAAGGDEAGKAGDLYFEILLAEHPLFVLHGRDLHCRVPVSAYRLLCGGPIEVPKLAGTTTLELSTDAQHPLEYRLPGLGFPAKGRRAAGDLVLQLERIHPQSITAKDRQLLERLAGELERRTPQLAAWEAQLRARRESARA
ncbi:MAG: Heat shock protein J [Candidatus Accumulibacter appositus]|uniref:Heat shock protein J n=1 Tax=Candidatus Accumulibacter appositus TaxID=1454003 RepID=A0A011PXR3_9PROT|nr:DnaJ C-terminal domain-containing protein [Accumulibacter sp.]EXI81792.1 MAG: Heat shock protein J [Candidatus Accumulibacter appositus]HRF04167.1 DnaJ C-terminal domain-containing protein [Accumulibacter sp.]